MKQEIQIENLKCGGCANTIKKGISSIEGVSEVDINVENSIVSFSADASKISEVKEKLSSLGYPEVGDKNTLGHKAKSFVSCAVGRVSS